jgi:hypothetical protein
MAVFKSLNSELPRRNAEERLIRLPLSPPCCPSFLRLPVAPRARGGQGCSPPFAPLAPLASYAAGEAVPLPAGYPTARDKLLTLLANGRIAPPILRVARGSKG